MEEELSILRTAFEQLAEKQETTIHSLTQRLTRNEREFEHELKLQRQKIDSLKHQLLQEPDVESILNDQHNLNTRMDRLAADQSLLWDSVGRLSSARANPKYKGQKEYRDEGMVNGTALTAESDRLMNLFDDRMANMAGYVDTNFEDLKEMIVETQEQCKSLVEKTVRKNQGKLHQRIETLVSQLNGNIREIEEVKEDQEVSNVALIDSLVSMKTKFDAVLEEVKMSDVSSSSSMEEYGGENTANTNKLIQQRGGKDPKGLLQLIERKNGQWNAQIKGLKAEIRTIKRDASDQRQDSADLKKVVEHSIEVLGQQAETTASLCERQLQRVHDWVRNEFVAENEFRKLQIDFVETSTIWKDRFNELLHALEFNVYSYDGGIGSPRTNAEEKSVSSKVFGTTQTVVYQSTYNTKVAVSEKDDGTTATSSTRVHFSIAGHDEEIIDLTAVSDERDDVEMVEAE